MPQTQPLQHPVVQERMQMPPAPQRMTGVRGQEERRRLERGVYILVPDVSSSQNEPCQQGESRSKLNAVIDSATHFPMNLSRNARLGIIAFNSQARVLWPLQEIGDRKLDIVRAIQGLRAEGTTAMEQALMLASQELSRVTENVAKEVYLLTDGLPDSDPRGAAQQVKEKALLYCIGFGSGMEIDEGLMKEMASIAADGSPMYRHFRDAATLVEFMRRKSREWMR